VSSVAVARLTSGRSCSRVRTRPAATIEPCRQASFIGPAIQRGSLWSTRAIAAFVRKRGERVWRILPAALPSSSHLRSSTRRRCPIGCASPGRGCGQWTVLLLSRAHRLSQRMLHESDSRTPNPLFRVSPRHVNKKQPFRRGFDEKSACATKCDALMSQKAAATSLPQRRVQSATIAQRR
jgi:hypothetical protein